MAIGIVSDKDFDSEVTKIVPHTREESNSESVISGEIIDVNRGRGKGNIEVPNGLRKIIGEESEINGRQSGVELASRFGISPSSTSAYANGATSTASYNNPRNQENGISSHINKSKERITKRARNKLMAALNKITDDKLEGAKARDLAGIAKDMSAVIKNMEPEKEQPGNNGMQGPTFVFYAPQFRSEENFGIVHVKE